jgi:hypothetical protein
LCFGLVDLKANFLSAGWLAGVDDSGGAKLV